MSEYIINAEKREDQGKGASRRLRRAGLVPGIVYGAGKEPTPISVRENELLKHLEDEGFYSQVLTLKLGGQDENVVLRDLQRHPYKPNILHFDLQRINMDEKLHVHVPLHFLNEESCVGVKNEGGTVSHLLVEVEVVCLPGNIPEHIDVDLSELHAGDTLHLSDLKVPEGVEILELVHGHDNAVVTILKPKGGAEEEAEGGEEAAAEEGGED
ncbi:MAG: 50S ribosomal protein L25/general stress protein Ctc [Gammaproteobacteria bacterium]|nr:MAG: 50S ribosomal protein L25/general stress protein Ctc [Gammaproteobacteria bacterium]